MTKVTFILGCTAGGKSALGLALAKRLGGEIVSVDSMKIYRRMDIGTAKPGAAARSAVPHHCLDLVQPSETFSVARYVESADAAIGDITARGKIVLAVGGTALYIKSLTEGLFAGPGADEEFRSAMKQRAAAEGLASLHAELARRDPAAGGRIHPNDERRIVRALEILHLTGESISSLQQQWDAGQQRYDCVFIGLRRSLEDTNHRINLRVKRMIEQGLREEVAALLEEPAGLSDQAAQAVGYAEMIAHLRGLCSLEEAAEQIKIHSRRLGKHQRTWFRRFAGVHWIDLAPDDQAEPVAEKLLPLLEK